MSKRFNSPEVATVFKSYPPVFKIKLLKLRKLIFEVSKENDQIGLLDETLKWGQPSYLPETKNVGTTVRIHWLRSRPDQFGMYFNCNTKLILQIKRKFGSTFKYEGKRAIIFDKTAVLPVAELKECIEMAFLYHYNKKL